MTAHDIIEHQPAPAANVPAATMAAVIERVVMDPNASVDKLERMLDMQERIWQREAKASYDRAIAAAKAEIPPIIKNAEVDYTSAKGRTHFKHETLDGIAKVVDPILSQHGLSYRFRSEQTGQRLRVTCVIAHRDGYSEETSLEGDPDASGSKNSYQAVGSAATYLQRYTLKLALGLSASKDDDAQAAGKDSSPISEEQFTALRDLVEASGADEAKLCAFFKIDVLGELPVARYGEADRMLRQKLRQAEKDAAA